MLFTRRENLPVLTSDFDYALPEELIAQQPAPERDASRLFVVHRAASGFEHRQFRDVLDYLRPGDVLVLNNSKVIPARLRARNLKTGGRFEVLLVEENDRNDWWTMMRPGKRAQIGTELLLEEANGARSGIKATVVEINAEGHRRLRFEWKGGAKFEIADHLDRLGELPLPPYIARPEHNDSFTDRERYQTVFAQTRGSVAAPTAGLHFTDELLTRMRARGVQVCHVTLHVGLGTFAPVKAQRVEDHTMHFERFSVTAEVAEAVNRAKSEQRRVVAVGTTSVRVLETLGREHDGRIAPGSGRTNIFIYPPYRFRIVDALITNFHLPKSTLLMLVSAFAAPGELNGRELMLRAYAEAVRARYRFFSYGDAMLML